MIKFTLMLSAFVVLAGCPGETSKTTADATKGAVAQHHPVIVDGGSPIIVSDGSTHLRHQSPIGGASDFQASWSNSGDEITINDALTVGGLVCFNIPSPSAHACTAADPSPLTAPWSIDVLNGDGNKMLTMSAKASETNKIVHIKLHGNAIDPEPDASTDTTGTDVTVAGGTFDSAAINGTPIKCSAHPGCKLRILYR